MADQEDLLAHLRHLEEQLLQPEVRTSPEAFGRLLADEFFEFGSSGTVWRKSDFIAGGGIEPRKMTMQHFDLHLLAPDVALVTYRIIDETRQQHTLRSSIWKRLDGHWQMIFHQGTPTSTD